MSPPNSIYVKCKACERQFICDGEENRKRIIRMHLKAYHKNDTDVEFIYAEKERFKSAKTVGKYATKMSQVYKEFEGYTATKTTNHHIIFELI